MYISPSKESQGFQSRDEDVRVRLGRIKTASENSVSRGIYKRLARAGSKNFSKTQTKTIQRAGIRRGNMFAFGERKFPQRVAVKVHYVKHKGIAKGAASLKGHTRYLARDGAGADGKQAPFFNATEHGLDPKNFVESCKADRHHFRAIISPEHGDRLKDFEGYVRKVMASVEHDLGTKLEWISVVHFNTDNPHAHVTIRGVDDQDKDLVIARDYIGYGIRQRAQEAATELLKERTLKEVQQGLVKEIEAERYTSIDRRIESRLSENRIIDARPQRGLAQNTFHESLMRGRLQYLERMGLARMIDTGMYQVSASMREDLWALSSRNDVVKNIYGRLGSEASHIAIHSVGKFKRESLSGRILDKGLHDELTDRRYIIIKDAGGRPHYVDVGRNAAFDDLQKGSLVRLAQPEQSKGKADYNILKMARENKGIYDASRHEAYVEKTRSDITPEKREDYMQRHIVRLESLEHAGVVKGLGNGRFEIPADLIERGKEVSSKINEAQKKGAFVTLSVLSEKPVELQITVQAWTWLDREIYKRSKGAEPSLEYDAAIKDAMQRRIAWLESNNYLMKEGRSYRMQAGTAEKLRNIELQKAGEKLATQTGKPYEALQGHEDMHGRYHGTVGLHSGRYAVIENKNTVSLAPVSRTPHIEQGAFVTLKPTGRGRFFIADLSRDKDHGKS